MPLNQLLSYKLFQFLVTDGMGRGRVVLYALVLRETFVSLCTLFTEFRRIVGAGDLVRTFVMDKCTAQMQAVSATFGCDIILCYFHVRQAIRKHVSSSPQYYCDDRQLPTEVDIFSIEWQFWMTMTSILLNQCKLLLRFQADLRRLERDVPFLNYLLINWIPITRMWAVHAQSDLVHFGNRTNNRVESAHGRLKKATHHRDDIAKTIQKVWGHSEDCITNWEMQAAYECDRRQVLHTDSFIQGVLDRLTIRAAQLVLKHLKGRQLTPGSATLSGGQVGFTHEQFTGRFMFWIEVSAISSILKTAVVVACSTNRCGSHVSMS